MYNESTELLARLEINVSLNNVFTDHIYRTWSSAVHESQHFSPNASIALSSKKARIKLSGICGY